MYKKDLTEPSRYQVKRHENSRVEYTRLDGSLLDLKGGKGCVDWDQRDPEVLSQFQRAKTELLNRDHFLVQWLKEHIELRNGNV
jgi:hypothetical protein